MGRQPEDKLRGNLPVLKEVTDKSRSDRMEKLGTIR